MPLKSGTLKLIPPTRAAQGSGPLQHPITASLLQCSPQVPFTLNALWPDRNSGPLLVAKVNVS